VLKKDSIFWWASAIFVVSLAIFAITQNQLWIFLMAGSYLLRPTLASLGVAKRSVDERQMSIQYRSGNIGFAAMIITCIILAVKLSADGNSNWEEFNLVVIVGLASKALFSVMLEKDRREAGIKIIITAGLLIALFAAADGGSVVGAFMQAFPGLAIVAVGLLARKFPKTIAVIIFAITAALLFVILKQGLNLTQFAVALVVCVPLILAGIGLIKGDRGDEDNELPGLSKQNI
jgi:hypothetical protein